jgi:hypothetical protein
MKSTNMVAVQRRRLYLVLGIGVAVTIGLPMVLILAPRDPSEPPYERFQATQTADRDLLLVETFEGSGQTPLWRTLGDTEVALGNLPDYDQNPTLHLLRQGIQLDIVASNYAVEVDFLIVHSSEDDTTDVCVVGRRGNGVSAGYGCVSVDGHSFAIFVPTGVNRIPLENRWSASINLERNRWYRLRVEFTGDQIVMFLEGVYLGRLASDDLPRQGSIGITAGGEAYFDNLRVSELITN